MSVPNGIIQGATGRRGAAYYGEAARIVAESAERQSQIIASQSALAMQSIGTLGQSLSAGLSQFLDYKLAISAQNYERELKLREASRLDQMMEMQKRQLEDEHLARLKDLELRDMEIAQKKRDVANVPLLAKARAEAAAASFMTQQAAARIQSGTATPNDYATIEGAFGVLGAIGQRMIEAGASPAETAELQNQMIPLVEQTTLVKLANGQTYNRKLVETADPTSYVGYQVYREAESNPQLASNPTVQRRAAIVNELLSDTGNAYFKAGSTTAEVLPKLLASRGIVEGTPEAREAELILRSFKAKAPGEVARMQLDKLKFAGAPEMQARIQKVEADLPGASARDVLQRLNGETAVAQPVVSALPGFLKAASPDEMSLMSRSFGRTGFLDPVLTAKGTAFGLTTEGLRAHDSAGKWSYTGETAAGTSFFPGFRKGLVSAIEKNNALSDVEQAFVYTLAHAADSENWQQVNDLMTWAGSYKAALDAEYPAGSGLSARFDLSYYQPVLLAVKQRMLGKTSPDLVSKYRTFLGSVAPNLKPDEPYMFGASLSSQVADQSVAKALVSDNDEAGTTP